MGKTKIEYADEVSNPLQVIDKKTGKRGTHCEKPDPEGTCKNCWAEVLNTRGTPDNNRFGTGRIFDKSSRDGLFWVKHEKEMRRLARLNDTKQMSEKFPGNPLIVFTNDTYDLFQPSISDNLRNWVFDIYDACEHLTLLIQSTYVARMRAYLAIRYPDGMPKQYVIGMSAGTQSFLDNNYRHLLAIPARRRYIIFEPLLEGISLNREVGAYELCNQSPLRGTLLDFIDLIIVGGESGSGARVCYVDWIRRIVAQAKRVKNVSVLVKQMGANCWDRNDIGFDGEEDHEWPMDTQLYDDDGTFTRYQGEEVRIRLKNRKGGDMDEWPEALRIREFPMLLEEKARI